jgi:acetylornithine aminotransferase
MGALSVTSNPKYQNPFKPLIPGVRVGKLNDQESIDNLVSEKTCAVIVEPIQGEGGIKSARADWLKALRKRCDEVGAVLIFDEIQVRLMFWFPRRQSRIDRSFRPFVGQCGLYRTGSLWAHSTFGPDCKPDIITMAKPLANGYPIGAVMMREDIAQVMSVGKHGN